MKNVAPDRLIFFGTDAFSVPSLVRLLAENWNLVGVVTKPDSRTGRGRELTAPAVKRLAEAQGLPVLQPGKLSEAKDEIMALRPDAGIVVAYGKIIPKSVLDLFPKGLINVHGSILPRYRGSSPIEAAILGGDDETGVTLMQLDPGMDTGPTYESDKIQLSGTETKPDLYEKLSEMGAQLLTTRLTAVLNGTVMPIPQDHAKATGVKMITKQDGQIDWNKQATQIEREIRAYLGWPGSHTTIAGTDVIITKASCGPRDGRPGTAYITPAKELAVYAKSGSLVITRLKPAGKSEMTGEAFLSGHKLAQ